MPFLDRSLLDGTLLCRSCTEAGAKKERFPSRLGLFSERSPNFFPMVAKMLKRYPSRSLEDGKPRRTREQKVQIFRNHRVEVAFAAAAAPRFPLERHRSRGYIFPFRSVVRLYFHPAAVSFPGFSKNGSSREIRAGKNGRTERNRKEDAADSSRGTGLFNEEISIFEFRRTVNLFAEKSSWKFDEIFFDRINKDF